MPRWLRNFTFVKISKFYEEQNKAMKGNAERSWTDPAFKNKVKKESKQNHPSKTISKPNLKSGTSYK